MKKLFYILLIFVIFILFFYLVQNKENKTEQGPQKLELESSYNSDSNENNKDSENSTEINQEKEQKIINLPEEHNNPVLFTSQAPYANWDKLHDEACEEASIIMAYYYLEKKLSLSKKEAEDEIQNMIKFQEDYFGSHKDLTVSEIIDLSKEFYQQEFSSKTLTDKKKGLIYLKENLAQENIFIIPAAGRELKNPYFKSPGPLYHALVLTGYDEKAQEFITNDPGTRHGENHRYSYDIIWNSIHDFPGKKEDILKGEKRLILVEK
ncbi:hypothetical protein EOM09_07330 [bacterium]|nr:hypothetical protein [bacterium]